MPRDDSDPGRLHLSFPSGEMEVRTALAALRHGLNGLKLSAEDSGTVELVLGEVLNNVVEHAYGADNEGPIEMDCVHHECALVFSVCDQGQALPGLTLPAGRPPELECPTEDLPEGGFGWFLVNSLTRDLGYSRCNGKNLLTFNIPLGKPRGLSCGDAG